MLGEAAKHYEITDQSKRKHRKTHGKIGFTEMATRVSKKWKGMDADQRRKYTDEAQKEKEKYLQAMVHWKITGSSGDDHDSTASKDAKTPGSPSSASMHAGPVPVKDTDEMQLLGGYGKSESFQMNATAEAPLAAVPYSFSGNPLVMSNMNQVERRPAMGLPGVIDPAMLAGGPVDGNLLRQLLYQRNMMPGGVDSLYQLRLAGASGFAAPPMSLQAQAILMENRFHGALHGGHPQIYGDMYGRLGNELAALEYARGLPQAHLNMLSNQSHVDPRSFQMAAMGLTHLRGNDVGGTAGSTEQASPTPKKEMSMWNDGTKNSE